MAKEKVHKYCRLVENQPSDKCHKNPPHNINPIRSNMPNMSYFEKKLATAPYKAMPSNKYSDMNLANSFTQATVSSPTGSHGIVHIPPGWDTRPFHGETSSCSQLPALLSAAISKKVDVE